MTPPVLIKIDQIDREVAALNEKGLTVDSSRINPYDKTLITLFVRSSYDPSFYVKEPKNLKECQKIKNDKHSFLHSVFNSMKHKSDMHIPINAVEVK